MKTITLAERARLARARPLPHHRPARHRGAGPRRHRPHGRAREVTRPTPRDGSPPPRSPRTARPTSPRPSRFRPASRPRAVIEFRSGGVLAGAAYADAVARGVRAAGSTWRSPRRAARSGPARWSGCCSGELARILRAERPMLNLLQRASGIATATRAYVDAVAGTGCRILHTRKTAPGLRALDIAAVLAGGGARHRVDLSHEVMVKDNHWQALRSGAGARWPTRWTRRGARGVTALYVEVESQEQLEQACAAGATRLLVDNQTPETVGPGAPARGRCGRGSRSRRRAGSRSRTCGRTRRRGRTSCRSGR